MKQFTTLLFTSIVICSIAQTPLQFIKTVDQKGPVAYRDPFGSISPDGRLLAYSDRNQLIIQQIQGGATFELQKQGAFIISLRWMPDSKKLVTYEIGGKKNFWYVYDVSSREVTPLWSNRTSFVDSEKQIEINRSQLRELSWSGDGSKVVGISRQNGKSQLWLLNKDGQDEEVIAEKEFIESPQWNPSNNTLAGVIEFKGQRSIQLDLANPKSEFIRVNCYGPIAFSPDGKTIYYSKANEKKVIDLHSYSLVSRAHEQLASFSRDSYAPSVSNDGSVLFKLQDYRVFIAATVGDSQVSQP
ncbi:MAG: hypothetical protein RLN86_09770, partial [Cyclobacteriaceae bacterium]